MKKYLALVLVGAMAAFGAGCSDDGGGGGGAGTGGTGGSGGSGGTGNTGGGGGTTDFCANNGGTGEITLPEEIDGDAYLDSDCTYLLEQTTFVLSGTTTIEAGTTIFGEPAAAFIVTTGGKVEAVGTAETPIVFTSSAPVSSRAPGDWGGVVLLGLAKINRINPDQCDGTNGECTDTIEGLDPSEGRGTFGGNDDTHDCGTLQYVRIEFAGFTFGDDNELNTLTLGGCGSDTTLEYIQAHRGEDDGLEFFGGTANAQYVLVSGTGDDGLDTDQGYTGTISNAIVHHFAGRSDDPRGIEADNWQTNRDVEPRSNPTFEYVTLIGDADAPTAQTDQGMVFRRGTFASVSGSVIVDFNKAGVDLRDDAWANASWDPATTIAGNCFDNNSPDFPEDVDCGGGAEEDCNDSDSGTPEAFFPEDTELGPVNSSEDPELGDVSGALDGSSTPDYSVSNANCMGAFAPSGTDWTTGWTSFPEN